MHLKVKRQQAFIDYIQLIYKLEDYLYAAKDTVLDAPSLKGDPNDFQLTSFELIFTSIYAIQEKYKRNYAMLGNFLEKGLEFNDRYQLGFVKEIEDVKQALINIKQKALLMQTTVVIEPIIMITSNNFRSAVEFYDTYTNTIFEIAINATQQIDPNKFNYRKYFKDDFYKYVKKLKFLMDLTSGSGYSLVNMRNCSVINALDDDHWIEDISKHYPKLKIVNISPER